ncbi:uncharacterized protein LOC142320204 [Lycorma delicatula]|uniref:uncharacterized protein LOC142320204 n=1 Tax=Lycorma delicatula TaxID=130591 RepID=UPI003F50FA2D
MASVSKTNGSGSNRTLHLSSLGLALQAFYINMTLDQAHGSEHFHIKPIGPPVYSPAYYGNYIDGGGDIGRLAFDTLHTFIDKAGHAGGIGHHGGYYDDSRGVDNAYDSGRAYGGTHLYGQGGLAGGQFGQHVGHNRGHLSSGFSKSYHKDERGDNNVYYDDGTGSGTHLIYTGHDARFKNHGGDGYKGGYHDSSLLKNAARNQGRYGSGVNYYGNKGVGHNVGLGGYGKGYGYGGDYGRSGRVLGQVQPAFGYGPLIKNSGLYVVPMPSKLYYD